MTIPLRQYWTLLVRYLKPQWLLTLGLALLIIGNIGLQLANPQIVAAFIDAIQAGEPYGVLLRAAGLFLGIAVAQQVVALGATYVSENVGWTATNALRRDLVAHTLRLDMGFHKARTPGEMIERIDGDVTALSQFFSQFVLQVLGNALLVLGVIGVLVREDWRLGVIVAVFAALTLVVLARLRNVAVPHYTAEREASAAFFGFLEERLAGTEDIRANGAQAYVMRRFYALMRDQLRKSLKAGWMTNVVFNATFILFALSTAAAFAGGTYLFRREWVTIGTVYLVYNYTQMLERPLRTITYQLQQLQRAGAGVGRIREILETETRLPTVAPSDARTLPSGALGVRFDRVTFAYEDEKARTGPEVDGPASETEGGREAGSQSGTPVPVLRDITFDLAPGAVLGLLGRTGSGKTTLIRLLLRLYDPDTGAVRLGDGTAVDVRDVPLRELRGRVGVVTQEIQLFNASVRDNLTFFDETIPDDRIHKVLAELGLTPWLASLPEGLDTVLAADGGGLSAGEAQLLAFTRIFLRDPGLVILDEATSRLDPATEQLIERAVDRLVADRTAIVIAHRLGTVERADEILILEDGRILERGRRAALAEDPASTFAHLLRTGLEAVMA
jgi:ABC-type multidrug transport system fused ATPase/permease subunit